MTIGFVIQGQGISEGPLIEAVDIVKARSHVVIDEAKLVPAVQARAAQVIFRRSDDDHAHERFDPVQFVEEMHAQAPPGALLHLGNEPGRGSLAALDAWTLVALQTCDRVGRKGVIFNFETGVPEPEDWRQLSASVQYAYANGHIVGLHEYFDVTVARSAPWHVGRFKNLIAAFGSKTPRIIITELGCAINYNPHVGWQVYHTQESYAVELVIAVVDWYAAYDIDALVYLLGYWDRTDTFDVRGQHVIFKAMEQVNGQLSEGGDMANVPGYVQAKTKETGARVNVRGGPGKKYAPFTTTGTGDWVKRLPGSTVRADGYTWAQIALDKDVSSHQHGWVALEVIDVD